MAEEEYNQRTEAEAFLTNLANYSGFCGHGKQYIYKKGRTGTHRLSCLFKNVVICGHCLVTLSLTINETLKWLTSLPILMQESFWW